MDRKGTSRIKFKFSGVSVEAAAEGRKLLDRVTRDCREDRPHISHTPYPVRLFTDPEAKLIRAVGAENQGHWAGTIAAPITYVVDAGGAVKWVYISASAADRPSPVALAKAAVSIAQGKAPLASIPGKAEG